MIEVNGLEVWWVLGKLEGKDQSVEPQYRTGQTLYSYILAPATQVKSKYYQTK